ncbi:hypothetical protein ACIGO9_30795 [Nocardia asteroides]|uniref:hypothetical protein n=1 Tax=Nocardia asteroides TaxID=1824 RepID=UPI0037C718D1
MQLPPHLEAMRTNILQEIETNSALSRQDRHEARAALGAAKLGGLRGDRVFTADPFLAWQYVKDLTKRLAPGKPSSRETDGPAVDDASGIDAAITAAEIDKAHAASLEEYAAHLNDALRDGSVSLTKENSALSTQARESWPDQWRHNALLLVRALAAGGHPEVLQDHRIQELITDSEALAEFLEELEISSAETVGGRHRAQPSPHSHLVDPEVARWVSNLGEADQSAQGVPNGQDAEEWLVGTEAAMAAGAAASASATPTPAHMPPQDAHEPAPTPVGAETGGP